MSNKAPNFLQKYLFLTNEIDKLQEKIRANREEIESIDKKVKQFVAQNGGEKCAFKVSPTQTLKVYMDTRRQSLSKSTLENHLISYFVQVFPDKPKEGLAHLAKGCADYCWKARKIVSHEPMLKRVVSKKRKKR